MKTVYTREEWKIQQNALENVFTDVKLRPFVDEQERLELVTNGHGIRLVHRLNGLLGVIRHYVRIDGEPLCVELSSYINDSDCLISADRAERIRSQEVNLDLLTGLQNNLSWETRFCSNFSRWARNGTKAAIARIDIDRFSAIVEQYGEDASQQLLVFVANQWYRYVQEQPGMVMARLLGHSFYIGSQGMDEPELEAWVADLHEKLPHCFTDTIGMMRQIPFTTTAACAGLEEVTVKSWSSLYNLCADRLKEQKDLQRGQVYRRKANV